MNAKIAVVGAGRVGSTLAYTLASSGVVREIVVIDANRERGEGEAMDIAHAVPFYAPVSVKPGGLADAAGAAMTVIAAGAAQREGESRPELLARNVELLRGIVSEVVRANPERMLLIATNPVDALTFAALRLSNVRLMAATAARVPAIVDRSGIRRVLPIPLSEEEIAGLRRSAVAVRDAVLHAGL